MNPKRAVRRDFGKTVFVNCPFDSSYTHLLRPLLFTIVDLGFVPRIASERADSAENRIDKIVQLIRSSQLSIHDLSCAQSSAPGEFARLNMPFELGIAYAVGLNRRAGSKPRAILVLEKNQYDLKRALSDLAGTDVKHHSSQPEDLIRCVRDWFVETAGVRGAKSATALWYRFSDFASAFYDARVRDGYSDRDLNFMPIPEYISFIRAWARAPR